MDIFMTVYPEFVLFTQNQEKPVGDAKGRVRESVWKACTFYYINSLICHIEEAKVSILFILVCLQNTDKYLSKNASHTACTRRGCLIESEWEWEN